MKQRIIALCLCIVVGAAAKAETGEKAGIIVLPPALYAVEGRECNVYFDNLLLTDATGLSLDVETTIRGGAQQNERFTVIPEKGGEGSWSLTLFDQRAWEPEETGECRFYVAPANAGEGRTLKVMVIGDSLTSGGVMTQTLLDCAENDPMKIQLIGTRGRGENLHEGRGGWSVSNYVTEGLVYYGFSVSGVEVAPAINSATYRVDGTVFRVQETKLTNGKGTIVCQRLSGPVPEGSGTMVKTEKQMTGDEEISYSSLSRISGNPFWFDGKVDFAAYLDLHKLERPDWVFILLGTNDIFRWRNDADALKQCAESFAGLDRLIASIQQSGVTHIGLMLLPRPSRYQDSFGSSYGTGQTRDRNKRNTLLWAKEMIATYGNREDEGLVIVPVNTAWDSENNANWSAAAPANSRTDRKISRQNNAVHPSPAGYRQLGDALWAFLKCSEVFPAVNFELQKEDAARDSDYNDGQ